MDQVLMVLTSHSELGTSGSRTGTWLEELASPFYVFREAGVEVELASIAGGPAPLDPASLDTPWLTASGRRFLNDPDAQRCLAQTQAIAALRAADFRAVFLVGGAGTVWDFPHSAALRALVEAIHNRGHAVAGICHGVIALASALGADCQPIVRGRMVTGISNVEDRIGGLDKIVPVLPEDELRRVGALYQAAAPFAQNVVRDKNLVTGQNPASASALATATLAAMMEQSAHLRS